MMTDDEKYGICMTVAFMVISAGVAGAWVHHTTRQSVYREAVRAGVAKYTATDDGEVRFEWIQQGEKQ